MVHLELVRQKLSGLDAKKILRLAADADVTIQTVMSVMHAVRDPRYSTVKRLHALLVTKPTMNDLELVRKKLHGITSQQALRLAADAEVAVRTVYNVADPARDPNYSTVYKLHAILIAKAASKTARKKKS